MMLALLAVLAAPESLSLQEAAALAASGAPAVERARAETDAAEARVTSARSRLGPALSADLGFLSSDNPVTVFSMQLEQERFSAEKFFTSDPNSPPFTKDWSGTLGLSWNVDLFGSTRNAARAAGTAAGAAAHEASRTRDAVVFQAIGAFAQARRAEESVAILGERETDAAHDVSLAESLHEQGLTTAADPARARAALAEVRAEAAGYRAAAAASRAHLAMLIGPEAAARPLAPLPPPAEPPAAPGERDDVVAAELAAAAARQMERAAGAARWPSLVLTAKYELHSPTPAGTYGDSATVFGGFHIPIFASGGIDARVAEARAAALSAEASAREQRRTAQGEVARARSAWDAAVARHEAFSEAESAARQAREIQQARYEEGAASLADLLEARAAELRARVGSAAAAADRVVALANLRLALGLPPEPAEAARSNQP
jgi:cobalt-zinc-cadmium efflux system outer membrane protein